MQRHQRLPSVQKCHRTHVRALVDVLARGARAGRRGQQPLPAAAAVGAGRVAARAAAARPRAAAALVHVAARAPVRAQVPALPEGGPELKHTLQTGLHAYTRS